MDIKAKFDLGRKVYWVTPGGSVEHGYITKISARKPSWRTDVLIEYTLRIEKWCNTHETVELEDALYATYEELDTVRLLAEKEECEKQLAKINDKLNRYKGEK